MRRVEPTPIGLHPENQSRSRWVPLRAMWGHGRLLALPRGCKGSLTLPICQQGGPNLQTTWDPVSQPQGESGPRREKGRGEKSRLPPPLWPGPHCISRIGVVVLPGTRTPLFSQLSKGCFRLLLLLTLLLFWWLTCLMGKLRLCPGRGGDLAWVPRGLGAWVRMRTQDLGCQEAVGPFVSTACSPGGSSQQLLRAVCPLAGCGRPGPTSRPGCPGPPTQGAFPAWLHWPWGAGGGGRPQISPITEALKIASHPHQGGACWGLACASPAPHSKVSPSVSHWNSCGRDWTSGSFSAALPPALVDVLTHREDWGGLSQAGPLPSFTVAFLC